MKISSWWECLVLANRTVTSKGGWQTAETLTMSPASGANRSMGLDEREEINSYFHTGGVCRVGPYQLQGMLDHLRFLEVNQQWCHRIIVDGQSRRVNNTHCDLLLEKQVSQLQGSHSHRRMNVLMNVWILPCSAQCFEWSCRPFNWGIKVSNLTVTLLVFMLKGTKRWTFSDRKKFKAILKLLLFSYSLFSCSLFMSDKKERKRKWWVSIFYTELFPSKAWFCCQKVSCAFLPVMRRGSWRLVEVSGGLKIVGQVDKVWLSREHHGNPAIQTNSKHSGGSGGSVGKIFVAAESKPSFCHAAWVISVLRLGVVGVPSPQVSPADAEQRGAMVCCCFKDSLTQLGGSRPNVHVRTNVSMEEPSVCHSVRVPSHPLCKLLSEWSLLNIITSTKTWHYKPLSMV